jgi:hypothetical protein
MTLCDFGCKQSAIKQFKSGKYCCSTSASGCPVMKQRNSAKVSAKRKELGDNFWSNGHPKGATGSTPWNKNKTGLQIAWNKGLTNDPRLTGKASTDEKETNRKNKLSKIATQRHANGWDNKAGRCQKYKYTSPVAGNVTLDGTWELAVAKWLDSQNFNWKRNTQRFQYINLKNVLSNYTPDFWVQEFNGYLEVKGYETKLDRCKWNQFTENLTVWKKKDLQKLNLL